MRQLLMGFGLLLALIFGWHLVQVSHVASEIAGEAPGELLRVTINPVTNVARISVDSDVAEDSMERIAADILRGVLAFGYEEIEREMALMARERLDVYAMVIPYRVRVVRD
jgi:DNA-binding protein YbaB